MPLPSVQAHSQADADRTVIHQTKTGPLIADLFDIGRRADLRRRA
jgi:hypothetical protein